MKKLFFITLLMWGVMYGHETNQDPYSGGIFRAGFDIGYHGAHVLLGGIGYNFHGVTAIVLSPSVIYSSMGYFSLYLNNEWYWGPLIFEHNVVFLLSPVEPFPERSLIAYSVGSGLKSPPVSLRFGATLWDTRTAGGHNSWEGLKWYIGVTVGGEPKVKKVGWWIF